MADVQVTFGANIQALISGVDNVKSSIDSIGASAKSLAEVFGVAFSISAIEEFVSQMEALGTKTEQTSAILGISTADTQQLGLIATATGSSADALALSMERLQKNLAQAQSGTGPAAQALQALGLSAKSLIGLSIDEQMNKIADAVARFGDGGNKTAIVLDLLGRSGAQMIPILDQGSAGLEAYRQRLIDAGTIMTGQTIAALSRMDTESGILGASLKALGGTLVALGGSEFGDFSKAVETASRDMAALASTGTLGEFVAKVTSAAWERLAGDIKFAKTMMVDFFTASPAKLAADYDKGLADIDAADKKYVVSLNDMIDKAVAGYKKLLAAQNQGSSGKPQAPALAVPNTDALKASQALYEGQIKAATDAYALTKDNLDAEVKLHETSYGKEAAALTAALNAEWAAESAAFEQEMALYAQGSAQWQKVWTERAAAYTKFIQEHQQVTEKAAEQDAKVWKQSADLIAGALNSQLQKMLQGKETFAQASRKIEQDLALKFIEDQVKATVEFLANQAKQLASALATQLGMTSASTAGAAARSAADVASGQESILSVIENAMKAIFAGAGQTAAGVSANVAPAVGPAAPAVGAAAGAAVAATAAGLAGGGHAIGDYAVPGEGWGYIHKNEVILPDRGGFAGAFRDAVSGGGKGGPDNAGMRSLLASHQDVIASIVNENRRASRGLQSAVDDLHQTIKKRR